MIQLITFQLATLAYGWIISKQDLNGASGSFIVSNWFQTSGGDAYTTSQTVCGQSLMKLDAPNTLYKDYSLVDAFFQNIRVEMDLYFVNFKTTTVTVKLNTVTLFTRTFDSTNSIVIDNLCNNPSTDFQYTLSGQVSSTNQNIRIEISYSTVPSPVGYLGIRNLNIYTDGIQTTNGCLLATPILAIDGVTCVVSCANAQQLSDPNLDKCGVPTPSTSLVQFIYAYTDTTKWVDYQSGAPVPRNAQYTSIYTSTLFFQSNNRGTNLLFYNSLASNIIFKFQFQFFLYILGTWENGSRISFCLVITNQYEIFTIEMINGQLITSDRKVTFSITSIPKGGGGTEQALVAFLVFEGFSDSGTPCFFGVKQNLVGSTASYGFGDLIIYRARVSLSTCQTFSIPNYCSVCYSPFYVYQGKCVNTCPSYSVIVDVTNKVCKDLNEYEVTTYFPTLSYNAVGTYLIIDYYDYTFTTESINSMFTFSPSTSNNFKNSQYFSFIANVKILGGYQSWGYGSFLKTFSNLSPHYQIRLYLQLYLIDTWTTTDTFKVLIDGQIVSTTSKTSSSQIQGKSELDQTIPLVIKVKHSSQSLSLELQCNNSAMDCSKGACGIANMFLLLDQDVNQVCPGQLQYYSFQTQSCQTCTGTCTTGCILSSTTCYQKCSYQCKTCSTISVCTSCDINLNRIVGTPTTTCVCQQGYFEIVNVSACQQCHYSCQSCTQYGSNLCLSCPNNATSYRTQSGSSCPCDINYIDVTNQVNCAYTCHYSCQTCSGPLISQCLTCPPNGTSHRTQSGNTCPCDANYVDVVNQQICTYTCDYRCLTCSGPLQNQCLTCPANVTSHRSQVTTTCPCDINYVDVATQQVCTYTCHYSCLTCSGPLNSQCLTCPTNGISHRTQSGNTCSCDANYFEVVNVQNCGYNCNFMCGSCTGPQPNECSSCISNSTSHRTQSGATCTCDSGYTDNGSLPNCIMICHHSCNTCTGLTDNDCIDCVSNSISHRTSQGSTCLCDADYFDVTNQSTCGYNCHVSCDTCTGPLINQCATCATNSVSHRTLNGTSCDCDVGYFDTNPVLANCAFHCHYSCDTCTGPLDTQCSACPPNIDSFRTQSVNSCPCDPNYFEISGQLNCGFNCEYTCDTCSGPLSNQCLTCPSNAISHRTQSGNTCPCDANYFEIPAQQICGFTCDYTCDTCFGPYSNQCSTCSTNLTYHRILTGNECLCDTLYFPVVNQMQCDYICHYSCATCNGPHDNQCLTCPSNAISHRTQSGNQCPCDTNYFNVINQSICGYLCHYSCDTCTGPEFNQCSTCPTFTLAFRLQVGNTCICDTDYHEGLNQQICLSNCHYSCLTCSTLDYNECLTCPINSINHRTLIGTQCLCDNQYYNVEGIKSCQPICHFTCKTCFGLLADQCSECNQTILSHRYLVQNKCLCNVGFRDVGIEVCKPIYCLAQCLTCIDDLSCQSCDPNKHRILHNQLCICMDQYYEYQNECLPCLAYCNTCLDNTSCLTCKEGLFRNFVANQCLCQQDYYDVLETIKCQSCIVNNAWFNKQCTKVDCNDGVFTYGEQCDDNNNSPRDGCDNCKIEKGFTCQNIPNKPSICYRCGPKCEDCDAKLMCLKCQDRHHLMNNFCFACADNCLQCNKDGCQICDRPIVNLPSTVAKGKCLLCEAFDGYYTNENNLCETKCGDSFKVGSEECDDGNLLNNDGCNQYCQVENGFNCQNNDCNNTYQNISIMAGYLNITSNNQLLVKYTSDIDICVKILIEIELFDESQFSYNSSYVSYQTDSLLSQCLVELQYQQSIKQVNIIHIFIPMDNMIIPNRILQQYREIVITPRQVTYVSDEQQSQTQSAIEAQQQLTQTLQVIGPITAIFGGFDMFLNVLDMLAWANVIYYFNVNFPNNVQELLKSSAWQQMQVIPNQIQLNQPSDDYYVESPKRFMEKGIDPLFINNIWMLLLMLIITGSTFIISSIIVWIVNYKYKLNNQRINKANKKPHNGLIKNNIMVDILQPPIPKKQQFSKIPSFIEYIYKRSKTFQQTIKQNLIKQLHLAELDLLLAILLQLQNCSERLDYLIIQLNVSLALICALALGLNVYLIWFVADKHPKLLGYQSFSKTYSVLYEQESPSSLTFRACLIVNSIQKISFMVSLVLLYDQVLLQILFCLISVLMQMFVIVYSNPFKTKLDLLLEGLKEGCLILNLVQVLIIGVNERVDYLNDNQVFNMGWSMLVLMLIPVVLQIMLLVVHYFNLIIDKFKRK